MLCPFNHLSLEKRRKLARLREQKIAVDKIACLLGRHRSTIYRELPLKQVLERKVRRAAEAGAPFIRVRDLFPQ